MKKRNDSGFLHLIAYLLIFIIFSFTLYACLDILDLIEVPEEYSISKWLSKHTSEAIVEDENESVIQNISKKVKVEIEKTTNSSDHSDFDISQISSYETSNFQSNTYETPYDFLYYNQLDDYAKIIYQELEKNLDNMKSGTYNISFGKTFNNLLHQENGEEVLNQSFQLAINALNFDHPDLFYLDVSKIYLLTKITTKLWITTYEVEIGASQGQSYLNSAFMTREEVEQAIRSVEMEKAKIKASLNGNLQNQIKGVHDYLIQNLEYDSTLSRDNIYNIYGALINRYTVCEGYARSFKYIMDDIGIPCIVVCGTAVNSNGETESHAWNYVKLNENWYAIDVTWDDPIIIGNGYINNQMKYKYYLKGADEFFTNHTEDGNIVGDSKFRYPALSRNNY